MHQRYPGVSPGNCDLHRNLASQTQHRHPQADAQWTKTLSDNTFVCVSCDCRDHVAALQEQMAMAKRDLESSFSPADFEAMRSHVSVEFSPWRLGNSAEQHFASSGGPVAAADFRRGPTAPGGANLNGNGDADRLGRAQAQAQQAHHHDSLLQAPSHEQWSHHGASITMGSAVNPARQSSVLHVQRADARGWRSPGERSGQWDEGASDSSLRSSLSARAGATPPGTDRDYVNLNLSARSSRGQANSQAQGRVQAGRVFTF